MKTCDIYGVSDIKDLESARLLIERILAMSMMKHESDARGGDYYRCGGSGNEHFILQSNQDPQDGEWTEPGCQDCLFILHVNETHRAEFIENALKRSGRIIRLKRDFLPD